MKDFIQFFIYLLCMSLFGLYMGYSSVIDVYSTYNVPHFEVFEKQVKECEKDLPRSQECAIVITYKAKPIEEEKND